MYSQPGIIRLIQHRKIKWAVRVASMGEVNACSSGKRSKGNKSLGRPMLRWEANIKMDLREIGFECVDGVYLTLDRDQWQHLLDVALSRGVP